jgi:hypothetical protein
VFVKNGFLSAYRLGAFDIRVSLFCPSKAKVKNQKNKNLIIWRYQRPALKNLELGRSF